MAVNVVVGERIVPPLAIVYLVVKLRIAYPGSTPSQTDKAKDEKRAAILEKSDDDFLSSRKEIDDMPKGASDSGYAHAPYWPAVSILLFDSDVYLLFLLDS